MRRHGKVIGIGRKKLERGVTSESGTATQAATGSGSGIYYCLLYKLLAVKLVQYIVSYFWYNLPQVIPRLIK